MHVQGPSEIAGCYLNDLRGRVTIIWPIRDRCSSFHTVIWQRHHLYPQALMNGPSSSGVWSSDTLAVSYSPETMHPSSDLDYSAGWGVFLAGMEGQQRATFACDACRQRKVKCNRLLPCSQCTHVGVKCRYRTSTISSRSRRNIVRGTVIQACREDSTSHTRPISTDFEFSPLRLAAVQGGKPS
jgi:hypothetical protein